MPKVAIVTLTRDRLVSTRNTFESMRQARPGHKYHHYVYDQGSTDGTEQWLCDMHEAGRLHSVTRWGENVGISVGFNRAFNALKDSYDFIMSVDNDCEFKTKHWLKKLLNAHKALSKKDARTIIAPRVKNLQNVPSTYAIHAEGGFRFSFVEILGGICRLIPVGALTCGDGFTFEERLPKAFGQDQYLAKWCRTNIIPMAYVENVLVRHMQTDADQQIHIPEYYGRKQYELYVPYGL